MDRELTRLLSQMDEKLRNKYLSIPIVREYVLNENGWYEKVKPVEKRKVKVKFKKSNKNKTKTTTTKTKTKMITTEAPSMNGTKKGKIQKNGGEVTLNGYFKVAEGTFEILKHNIENKINTLLIGPTGLGKTDIVANIAKVLGLPLTIFDMGTMTDPIMGLVGTHIIEVKDGKTSSQFKKSRFSEVIQKPGIVLLDEVNRAAAAANNLLFPCLDFRRELPMEYSFGDTTPVEIHKDCVFFATANIGSQYTGTHKLDRALIDRFMIISVDALSKDQIISSLEVTHPNMSGTSRQKIVNVYQGINKEHDEFRIGFNLSIRHLKTVATLVENGFSIYDSYYAICKGLGGKEGLKAIETILKA